MSTDLFSSLDGGIQLSIWVPPFLPFFFIFVILSGNIWLNSYKDAFCYYITNFASSAKSSDNHTMLFIYTVFIFIIINNYSGLWPLVYGITTNLWVVSSLALMLWASILISGYVKSPKLSLAHLAPAGAPMVLLPLLVLIETISLLIRPLTLTVRLIANISAGHIVMSLMSNLLSTLSSMSMLLSVMVLMTAYTLFEFFVSTVQAYIFCLLVSLYAMEHP
uniref:ATP synthase subunit a n=1 Tax=Oreohelix idahoensis TaxID=2584915 RepID=A0A4Y5P357_9EUPU|nr:ATP synthase F0 subunit 6 [Oreohelix idahoensis]QCW57653.1 ATP synthase F0 subunit 6 [Oreohelix idahoensis]UKG20815.1 ATP synthase F0 subunit 6 [Oreohelix idahoensis]